MIRMPTVIVVKAAFDPEAAVWYVESSDLPGLNLEASSVEDFREKVGPAVLDLLEAVEGGEDFDVSIEIIAHASARARSRMAA